jgi:hypothetical protein
VRIGRDQQPLAVDHKPDRRGHAGAVALEARDAEVLPVESRIEVGIGWTRLLERLFDRRRVHGNSFH